MRKSLALLIDTQAIVWLATAPERLSQPARRALEDESIYVSVVTAFEYSDLNVRRRFGVDMPLDPILRLLDAEVLAYPAAAWTLAASLPKIHLDPVDRMLVAHAIYADLSLVTADTTIRDYPVRAIW